MRLAVVLLVLWFVRPMVAAQNPAPLEVTVRLTGPDDKPLANVRVRVVAGPDDLLRSGSGQTLTTSAAGEATVNTVASIVTEKRKVPTNFFTQLGARPVDVETVRIGLELRYLKWSWLYVVSLCRFRSGDVLLEGIDVYASDAKGDFTRQVKHDRAGWRFPELGGLVLTTPGYEVTHFSFERKSSGGAGWRAALTLRRAAEPLLR